MILGYDIFINTDHKPLIYLLRHVDPTSRLYRYQLTLMEYNIKNISYIEGKSNHVADYLSRFSLGPDEDMSPTVICTIDSEMAQAPPPNYSYEKSKLLSANSNTLTIFCANTRNVSDQNLVPELPLLKPIVNKRTPLWALT